ncbi:hypothetical protein EW146_g4716 [Bondarzewia mesenterica]|uniref:Uncharacterized protein n=1 Tax=Bondarzewia mesenterica TaxID=1095465 RepID=A0A4S4LU66_9AGAM|nr:hypothetical protein EW146_g4716 [Bondarzewia mesenterica]
MYIFPQAVPPALLFAVPLLSFVLLFLQLFSFFNPNATSSSHGPNARTTWQWVASFIVMSLTLLSVVAGSLGIVAYTTRESNPFRSTQYYLAGQIVLSCTKFELGMTVLYLLNQHPLIGPLTSSSCNFARIRLPSVFLALLLICCTVASIVFASLQATYPASCIPPILWLLFICSSLFLVDLLYFRSREASGPSRLSALWILLGIGQIAAILSSAFSAASNASLRIPESLFTVIWIACTMLASHGPPARIHPGAHIRAPTTAQTATSEDFTRLHDPFASPPIISTNAFASLRYSTLSSPAGLIIEKPPSAVGAGDRRYRHSDVGTTRGSKGASVNLSLSLGHRRGLSRKPSSSSQAHVPLSAPSLVESEYDGERTSLGKRASGDGGSLGSGLGLGLSTTDLVQEAHVSASAREEARLSQVLLKVLEEGSGSLPVLAPPHEGRAGE